MLKILFALKNPSENITALLQGHKVDIPGSNESISRLITKNSYDLVLTDDGIEILQSIKIADPRVEIILFGDKEEAIEATKHGASAYFSLPVDTERLKETIDSIQDVFEMRRETAELERLLNVKYTFAGVIGKNPQMLDIFNFIKRIAPYYKCVTIIGETGTGKEIIAKALHSSSPVAKSPFVVCNCGALVESLVESELFGHIKGSFTGAVKDKIGLFEAAADGTMFLDEIGELPLSFQPHLLRVLQDGEFRRIGSHQPSKARCRVMAATNKEDLANEVKIGRFREDLFYRLTPLIIHVPPLRDRKDDIPLFCRFFLDRFNRRTGKKILGISRPAQTALMSHDWPGNVRELENVIEQTAILTNESFIRLNDLPEHIREASHKRVNVQASLDDVMKTHIETVLRQCNGNKTNAAKILGISRRALLRKINKYSTQ